MTRDEERIIKNNIINLESLLSSLDDGSVKREDLPEEIREKLRKMLE